ncbi:hypothetical protein CRUP_007095 [Coryphaenoides rupestris]|nr:hypothetical protein CRUP_007095 [Coryphaenoides rupestris]
MSPSVMTLALAGMTGNGIRATSAASGILRPPRTDNTSSRRDACTSGCRDSSYNDQDMAEAVELSGHVRDQVVRPPSAVAEFAHQVGDHGVQGVVVGLHGPWTQHDLLDQGRLRHMHGEDAPEARLPHGAVALQALQLQEGPGTRDGTGRDVKSGRDSALLANKSHANLANDGPGISARDFTDSPVRGGSFSAGDAIPGHPSSHLTRGDALRLDTLLRACCSILVEREQENYSESKLFVRHDVGSMPRMTQEEEHQADTKSGLLVQLTYLSFGKEVGQVLHGVTAETSDVLVAALLRGSQRADAVLHVVRHFHADLQP